MVRTESGMVPLGTRAAHFSLPDASGREFDLEAIVGGAGVEACRSGWKNQGLLVMFICNHCPFVVHVAGTLAGLCKTWQASGISVVAINSNDIDNYPEDRPEKMTEFARQYQFSFPYLFDQTQEVARAYQAACTPEFYLFDRDLSLVYRGQMDSSRPGNSRVVDGADLQRAVEALLSGSPPLAEQFPSMGCNIKWRPEH